MADARSGLDIAQLVAEYHQQAYRYAYRLTGSVHDAEDLTQELFLVACRKLEQLRNVENAQAWLFAILRNCFLKDRQRRRPALAVDLALDVDLLQAAPIDEKVDRDRLQAALNRLPEASRMVILMFYFEGSSYREIAERLEMPIGTVMSRLARAKEYLRSILTEPDHGREKHSASVAGERG
jgi:RNA polymerase sigma-70 factor, ECF subfamily